MRLGDMISFILLALCFGCTTSAGISRRVVGGYEATIEQYPSTASVHKIGNNNGVSTICGGAVLSESHILTAAHCFRAISILFVNPRDYKVRVGTALANSGGTEHAINMIMFHPNWNRKTFDNDLAIMRTATTIRFIPGEVSPALIASPTYRLRDNETLWAVGWGITESGYDSEQLREVELLVINQGVCKGTYKDDRYITENLLCSGWPMGGGHDQCTHDSGSPIYHNGVVVGIASQGHGCGDPEFPGINVRVSSYASWIKDKSKTDNIVDRPEADYMRDEIDQTTKKKEAGDDEDDEEEEDEEAAFNKRMAVEHGLSAVELLGEAKATTP